jgi:predicted glutamine amidotransferase
LLIFALLSTNPKSVMDYNYATTIMCLLIVNQTALISKNQLKNAWDNNSHGGGMAYPFRDEDNKSYVFTDKFDNFDDFYDEYVSIRNMIDKPMILHFRISSSGGRSKENIHPFYVRKDKLAMAHNGTIRSLGDDTMSDSRHLAQIIGTFKGNSVAMLKHSGLRQLVYAVIGQSKLAFVDSAGNFEILNEHLGHWTANGDWMSNDSYKEVRSWVYQGNKKVSKSSLSGNKTTTQTYKSYKADYKKSDATPTRDLFKDWDKDLNVVDEQFDLETNTWTKL